MITDKEVADYMAPFGGGISEAKAREVLNGRAERAAKEAKPEEGKGEGLKPDAKPVPPQLKGALTRATNALANDPENPALKQALADAQAAVDAVQQ